MPTTTTPLKSDSTGWDSFLDMRPMTNVPSGEEQRKFRRTVYTHDDWKKHRSQDRFLYYLLAIFKSGVYKNLGREVSTVTLIAASVVAYNAVVGGYQDLDGVKQSALISSQYLPVLTLPMTAFTLTSPALGLLLGKCKLSTACCLGRFLDPFCIYYALVLTYFFHCTMSVERGPFRLSSHKSSGPIRLINAGTKHGKIGV